MKCKIVKAAIYAVEDFIEYLQNLKLQENEYFTCNLDS